MISYQADTRGCGMNKLSAERGGLTKPPGFAESPWKNANAGRERPRCQGGWSALPLGWAVPQAQVALSGSHGAWHSFALGVINGLGLKRKTMR